VNGRPSHPLDAGKKVSRVGHQKTGKGIAAVERFPERFAGKEDASLFLESKMF